MSHDEGQRCLCVSEHRPYPLELQRHHLLPLSLGGLDEPDNIVYLCPTTHIANVHELLRLMFSTGRTLTDHELQAIYPVPVSRYAADLARTGYRLFTATEESTP